MPESGQIRINELARELEIKAKVLIDYLPEIGITEKKTHSSSVENDQADRVRKHFHDLAAAEADAESAKQAAAAAAKARPAARPAAVTSPPTGTPAPAAVAPPAAAKPAGAPAVAPGVKPPVRPGAVQPLVKRPAPVPGAVAPAAGIVHPPASAPRPALSSTAAPAAPAVQRPGAPPPQRSPIVNRPAAAGGGKYPHLVPVRHPAKASVLLADIQGLARLSGPALHPDIVLPVHKALLGPVARLCGLPSV